MKFYNVILCCILGMLMSCTLTYRQGPDFLRNYVKTETQKRYFTNDDNVYLTGLNSSSIVYFGKKGKLDVNNEKDVETYKSMIDRWNLEPKDDFGYKTPSEFFSQEYNRCVTESFSCVNNTSGKKCPVLTITSLDSTFELQHVVKKTIKTSKDVSVLEPADITVFCKSFLELHPDATHLILANTFYISRGAITYPVVYDAQSSKFAATVLIPKTIIDLKTMTIVGYDINQTPMLYSFFSTIRNGIKSGFKLEGNRLRTYF